MNRWPNLFSLAVKGEFDKNKFDKQIKGISFETSLGSNVLHFAVLGGCAESVRYFIDHGINVNAKNHFGETPLHWCCKEGNIAIALELLNAGARVDIKDCDNNLPIHWAAEYEQNEILFKLLQLGSSSTAENAEGYTPMHLAIVNNSTKCIALLNEHISTKSISIASPRIMSIHSKCIAISVQ